MQSKKVTKIQARQALEALGPKVKVLGRVKDQRFPAAYDGKGRILQNVVIIDGNQVEFPVCHYELRYTENGKDRQLAMDCSSMTAEASPR
jgi:hypothetical protein